MDDQTLCGGPDKRVPPRCGPNKHVPPKSGPDKRVPPRDRFGVNREGAGERPAGKTHTWE